MKALHSALVVVLLYYSRQVTAGGTLKFVETEQFLRLPYGREAVVVSTNGGFKFGGEIVDVITVTAHGIILMGEGGGVAPYIAIIETSNSDSVLYTNPEDVNSFTVSSMSTVSSFIRCETGDKFHGNKMIGVKWSISEFYRDDSPTNSFQCILITDGISSYAVFIYECGGMEWGGGGIGWLASSSIFQGHFLSIKPQSNLIGCLYSSSYSAIVYRVDSLPDSTCTTSEFACEDGECISRSVLCDEYYYNDCTNGSEEAGCGYEDYQFTCKNEQCVHEDNRCDDSYGGAQDSSESDSTHYVFIGFGISLFVMVVGAVCIVIICIYKRRRAGRAASTRAAVTNPTSTRTTPVSLNQTSTSAASPNQPTSSFTAPVPLYPQETAHKDAELSSPDAPPSYTEAMAYPLAAECPPPPVAGYPPHQNPILYTVPDPRHASAPPLWSIPQPDDSGRIFNTNM